MGTVALVVRKELALALRRPLFWFFLVIHLLFSVLYFLGNVQIGASSGGLGEAEKVHINGPFQLALFYQAIPFIVCTMFAVVALGATVMRDQELRVEEVLRSTHLSARQYVVAKFLGTALWVVGILVLGLLGSLAADAVTSRIAAAGGTDDPRVHGPFRLLYHLYPFVLYTLPWVLFAITGAFYLGVRTRSPLILYGTLATLYAFLLIYTSFSPEFLDQWSRNTLGVEWDRLRSWFDPSGLTWLLETFAKEDRGVRFYNTELPHPDLAFALNRGVLLLGAVLFLWRSIACATRQRHGKLSSISTVTPAESGETLLPAPLAAPARGTPRRGFLRVFLAELRLLRRQPSVWIFTPLILLFTVPGVFFLPGPWDARTIVTAGHAARELISELSVWLTVFGGVLVIESLHRERVTGMGELLWSAPVGTGGLVLAKVAAVLVLLAGLAAAAMLLTLGFQGLLNLKYFAAAGDGSTALLESLRATRPDVYARDFAVLLLPGLLFFVSVAALLATFFRSRVGALGSFIAFGAAYAVGLLTQWLDWRGRVIPVGLTTGSDITGLAPYGRELFWNRLEVASLSILFLLLAVAWYPRNDRPRLARVSFSVLRRHKFLTTLAVLLVAAALTAGIALDRAMDRGPEAEHLEDRADEYARQNRNRWGGLHREFPEYELLDLDVALYPAERRFELDGTATLRNWTQETFRSLPLTVHRDWDVAPEGHFFLQARDADAVREVPLAVEDRNGLYELHLPEPLPPEGECTLAFRYSGVVNPGAGKTSGQLEQWILDEAVFLHSLGLTFLPAIGFVDPEPGVIDTADASLDPGELAAHYEGDHPAELGGRRTFHLHLRVSVPEGMTALSAGTLVGREDADGRSTFEYRTDHPVYFFPILAGRWAEKRAGDCVLYHHGSHFYNVDILASTLDRSRRFYSAVFSPYPFAELRIVEFPGVSAFAMGFPTLIPFSETIGFLTQGEDGISNINFMVTAHEVAHQWWGTITTPAGNVPGSAFLTEALAHYSTLLMEERFNGRVAARNRRLRFEEEYLKARHADVERPIVRIDGSEPGDQSTWYNKGGLVFWMTSETLGRERFVEALRTYIAEFAFQSDHPTIFDLLRHVQAQAGPEHEEFLRQWFHEVVLPRPEVQRSEVRPAGDGFEAVVQLRNAGTGTIDLELEVANRRRLTTEVGIDRVPERLSWDGLEDAPGWESEGAAREEDPESAETPEEEYRAVRTRVKLAAGEETEVTVATPFEPRFVLLDPEARLLLAGRSQMLKALGE